MTHRMKTIIIITCVICLVSSLALANGQSSARSVAMGGAFTSLATGVEAFRYNPANLGLQEYQKSGMEILGMGANISNNSFSLDDYNKYSGAFITSDDKEYILGRVPDEGLSVSADIEATAIAFSTGPFAFFTTGVGQAEINLNKDLINLVMNGNTYGDTIEVTGSFSDAIGYVAGGISYGLPLYTFGSKQLAVGITAKYIRGMGIEQVTELEGLTATYETGFAGEGHMTARTATDGTGYSVDFGAALQINNSYTVGARISNFMSSITWSKNTEEHGYVFSFDTMTAENMTDDYITSEDYSIDIPSFKTSLPAVLNVGVANTSGSLLWAVDWEQGFRRAAGSSKKPRISMGLEWTGLLKVFPLRTGFASGGNKTTSFSFGTGIHINPIYLDVAAVSGSSISPYSSKGLNLAMTAGILF